MVKRQTVLMLHSRYFWSGTHSQASVRSAARAPVGPPVKPKPTANVLHGGDGDPECGRCLGLWAVEGLRDLGVGEACWVPLPLAAGAGTRCLPALPGRSRDAPAGLAPRKHKYFVGGGALRAAHPHLVRLSTWFRAGSVEVQIVSWLRNIFHPQYE